MEADGGGNEVGKQAVTNGIHQRGLQVQTDLKKRPSLETRLATNCLEPKDIELLEGFEFDSDVDMSSEEEQHSGSGPRNQNQNRQDHVADRAMDDAPWNPVCIVGLRVYSKDPELLVGVVQADESTDQAEGALDIDDQAASSTIEFRKWDNWGVY